MIETEGCGVSIEGNGVAIDENSVLTAAHLVGNDDDPLVVIDGEVIRSRLEVWSSVADLAILRTEKPLATSIPLADSDSYQEGDTVMLTAKTSEGEVRSTGTIREFYLPGNFRASFESSPGLSGAAITNTQQELVGLNLGTAIEAEGSFVVEAALVDSLRGLDRELEAVEGADCAAFTATYPSPEVPENDS